MQLEQVTGTSVVWLDVRRAGLGSHWLSSGQSLARLSLALEPSKCSDRTGEMQT